MTTLILAFLIGEIGGLRAMTEDAIAIGGAFVVVSRV
jgi:uncharacterized membrane protein